MCAFVEQEKISCVINLAKYIFNTDYIESMVLIHNPYYLLHLKKIKTHMYNIAKYGK